MNGITERRLYVRLDEFTNDEKQWMINNDCPFYPISGGGGGGSKPPQPSPEQIELQREQINLLRQQREEQNMYKPYLLESMNLVEENGTLRPMTQAEIEAGMSEEDKQLQALTQSALERQRLAAEGKLPVSPALEQSIGDEQGLLLEDLARRLGPQYANSTPGIKSLGMFNQKANLLRDESRRGEIEAGSGLLLNQMGYLSNAGQRTYGNLSNPFNTSALTRAYSVASQPFINQSNNTARAGLLNTQNKAAQQAGWARLGGQILGAGAGLLGNLKPNTEGTHAINMYNPYRTNVSNMV